jgi:hypothetical protein
VLEFLKGLTRNGNTGQKMKGNWMDRGLLVFFPVCPFAKLRFWTMSIFSSQRINTQNLQSPGLYFLTGHQDTDLSILSLGGQTVGSFLLSPHLASILGASLSYQDLQPCPSALPTGWSKHVEASRAVHDLVLSFLLGHSALWEGSWPAIASSKHAACEVNLSSCSEFVCH